MISPKLSAHEVVPGSPEMVLDGHKVETKEETRRYMVVTGEPGAVFHYRPPSAEIIETGGRTLTLDPWQ